MERLDLDAYYLKIAQAVAQRATCLRKQYGAVLVQSVQKIITVKIYPLFWSAKVYMLK